MHCAATDREVGRAGVNVRGRVVRVCQMDDAVCRGGGRPQAVEVVKVAVVSRGARGR
jgi:hypothetical protein